LTGQGHFEVKADLKTYFDKLPADRRQSVLELHHLVVSSVEGLTVNLAYRMPTYRRGDGWVALANQKNYISLYTCSAEHLAEFKARHPDIKTGKGCINFQPGRKIPFEDLRAVIVHAIEHPKSTKK